MPDVPRLALNVGEAAHSIGVSPDTIRRWINDGHLATVPHTRRTLIPYAALEAFVGGTQSTAQGDTTPLAAFGPRTGHQGA